MTQSTLYDDDILLWSEQQAEVIRKLGTAGRQLPNELDVENVAEEIESVGRSELAAVASLIRQILLHLIKLVAEGDATAVRHWQGEILAFHDEMLRRYAPSMRQRINLQELWRSARDQLLTSYEGAPERVVQRLPDRCPFELDDVLEDHIESSTLVDRMHRTMAPDLEL
jgi:hypothetical protein